MNTTRQPAVAGSFYPRDARALRDTLTRYLTAVDSSETDLKPNPKVLLKAIIVPHAGYVYSGPVAASAYVRLAEARTTIKRVVLLGPAHRVPLHGLAASSAQEFATPLGRVPVDQAAIATVLALPQVHISDEAHAPEHSLEVQLPFLQVMLDHFSVVPLVVGQATPAEVEEVLNAVWGGPETLIVVSSDLSHYYNYATAQQLDRAASRAIQALRPQDLSVEQACGRYAIQGLLLAARGHGLHVTTLDLRNSGDTAGPRDEVVGYGAYVFAASQR